MTCFWDAILQSLTLQELKDTLKCKHKPNPKTFSELLRRNVVKTHNVMWNNEKLSDRELSENFEHIQSFDPNTVKRGYDCSSCDPFLLLICQLFKINIRHKFLKATINYTYIPEARKTLQFGSNRGHFYRT